jgi:hypothetical protein
MHPLGDSFAHYFGIAGKQFMELWKNKREKEGKGESDKGKNLGKSKKQVTHFDQLTDDPSRTKSEN